MNTQFFSFIWIVLILGNNYQKVAAGLINIPDISKSLVDIASGVAQKIPESIPSPDAIFSASKNLIAGYPIELALSAVNVFCIIS